MTCAIYEYDDIDYTTPITMMSIVQIYGLNSLTPTNHLSDIFSFQKEIVSYYSLLRFFN
jgi:hypothetical protein